MVCDCHKGSGVAARPSLFVAHRREPHANPPPHHSEAHVPEQFSGLVEIQTTTTVAATTVSVDGDSADVKVGGNGQGGEVLFFRADGDRASDGDATVQLDGELADFRMGGQ